MTALAIELRSGREKTSFTLDEMATLVFSSKASVSRWLNGLAVPTRAQAQKWAEVCGTDEATILALWDSVESVPAPGSGKSDHDAVVPKQRDDGETSPGTEHDETTTELEAIAAPSNVRSRLRHPRRTTVALTTVVIAAAIGVAGVGIRAMTTCHASPAVVLYVPSVSGRSMGITARAQCSFVDDRSYLLIEEVPDVDPQNPHPVYFVKVHLPDLGREATTSHQLLLEEPVGTRARFYVVSVDAGGARAIEQNKVRDEGLLQLPHGTRHESDAIWHTKGWENP